MYYTYSNALKTINGAFIKVVTWGVLFFSLFTNTIFSQCNAFCDNPGFENNTLNKWNFLPTDTVKNTYTNHFIGPQISIQNTGFDSVLALAGHFLPTVNPLNGGQHSVMIGDSYGLDNNGSKISYSFIVTPALANFKYSYAVVINDAGFDHTPAEQPYFSTKIKDQNGAVLPCGGDYKVVGGPNIPNFIKAFDNFSPYNQYGYHYYPLGSVTHPNEPVYYRPWTDVYVDLSNYIGQCVTVEYEVHDCTKGGHFAYAYVDMSCNNFPTFDSSPLSCTTLNGFASAPIGALGYTWSGAGIVSGINNDSIIVNLPGIYTVTMDLAGGCQKTAQVVVANAADFPVASFQASASTCAGLPITLTNTTNTNNIPNPTWQWDFENDGTVDDVTFSPTNTYATDGTYSVKLTATNGLCEHDTIVSIIVNELPVVDFTASNLSGCGSVCTNFNATGLINVGTITNYNWFFSDGSQSSVEDPSKCFTSDGLFSVTVVATSNKGCTASNAKPNFIEVYPTPVADFATLPSSADILNPEIDFVNQSSGATNYSWSFGDGDISTNVNSQHYYDQNSDNSITNYFPQLIAENQYGCKDTVIKKVEIRPVFSLYVPNAFTPNNDGINDIFQLEGVGIREFELLLFNRWGEQIWATTDFANQWDGKSQKLDKTLSQIDVYVWKANVIDIFGSKHILNGHVSLIR
ncbi:MAG: gliding motility-associated C-terminal domain-containing protein [Bacteroidetes bacterium]|nr:gliding motility-associated C-terminal domain-containing protein [Bacteroidota bacterium]